MTTSKSSRATMFPASLHIPTLRSKSANPGEKPPRKLLRRRSTFDFFRQHPSPSPSPSAAASPTQKKPSQREALVLSKDGLQREATAPVPRPPTRSKTWGIRIFSFLPPLVPQPTESRNPRLISRKAGSSTTASSTRSSSSPSLPSLHLPPPATLSTRASPPPPPPTVPPPPPPPPAVYPLAPYPADSSANAPSRDGTDAATRSSATATPSYAAAPPGMRLQQSRTMPTLPILEDEPSPSASSVGTPRIVTSLSQTPTPSDAGKLPLPLRRQPEPSYDADPHADRGRSCVEASQTRSRNGSVHHLHPSSPNPRLRPRATSPLPHPRGRLGNAPQPPPVPGSERPRSSQKVPSPSLDPQASPAKEVPNALTRGRRRMSWFPGAVRSRSPSRDVSKSRRAHAWVISDEASHTEYNSLYLKSGEKVPELWHENGNVYLYLYPRRSGCGPSFKVPEFTISNSYVFNELIMSELESSAQFSARSLGGGDARSPEDAAILPASPLPSHPDSPGCMRLYLPAAPPSTSGQLAVPGGSDDAAMERLIAIRNLFAFLTGQPLVGTMSRPTTFHAFLEIAQLLAEFSFHTMNGDTFGPAVDLSFGFYSDQLALGDCRHSREKTIEALILGERMRSLPLYNEAFAHATGKYSAIMDLKSPLFDQVSEHTRQRLERAHLDLVNRQHNVNEHLEQFEFPSLFAGIANSSAFPELKQVRFKVWRNSFNKMRSFILAYYRTTFGSWPPKASSKRNPFAESGLNRLVLKTLYSDMCALYDLLVDRANLTSRVMDEVPAISEADKMTTSALRNIMSEFDRSRPPVLPPVPFDLPLYPSMTAIHETFNSLSAKDQNRFTKRIKENELLLILNKAYNFDVNNIKLPFLEHFKDFESREAKGKTCQDLMDQRIGYWLFLYVVVQSLPMLVVDAPDLRYTDGVEYFLCEPPMGNPPWVDDGQVRKMWYEITGASGRMVELSADAVMFSVEATYHRSHCWLAAKMWEEVEVAGDPPPPLPLEEPAMPALEPPRPLVLDEEAPVPSPPQTAGPSTPLPPPAPSAPSMRSRTPRAASVNKAWRSSIAIGLEPVPMDVPSPLPASNRCSSLGRPQSSYMGPRSISAGNLGTYPRSKTPPYQPSALSGATFDDILGDTEKKPDTRRRSRFF